MNSNDTDTLDPRGGLAGNLPAEPNAFIGRERDLADLTDMLGHVRALTLCGPGGIGKTRLALKLAASLIADFPDGVWLADLADVDAPDRLIPLVTGTLGIRQEPERPLADTLAEALRGRTMLLVLDTCEHLVQASAELVQWLLGGCPGLRVIATSREALRVRGEVIWRVPPLGLPAAVDGGPDLALAEAIGGYEAIRLFVARACAARPGFSLNAANAAAVAEVCRTLDGLPLAIELAAARVRTLSAEQIRIRLARRFELLAIGDRTAPVRQQTLRAAVTWSYDLLNERERKLLSRLSVFHGWSLEMAEQVCADEAIPAPAVLDLLAALIDKSLVTMEPEVGGVGRYRLLDTVRELAAERAEASGEMPALRAAHRDCMLAIGQHIAGRAFVRGDPPWPERVAMYHRVLADRPNFNQAIRYCISQGDAEAGLRLCIALSGSWLANGDGAQASAWIDQLLAAPAPVPHGVRSRALAVRAELAFEQQDYPGSARFAAIGLELSQASGDGNPATALRMQALIALMAGRAGESLTLAERALAAARQMADEWEEGVALAAKAAALAGQGLLGRAQLSYREALDVLSGNNRWAVANVLYGLGQIARSRGDTGAAVRYFSDALDIYRQIDARPEMARCLGGIGLVALAQPDLPVARASLTESLRLSLATGQRLGIARSLAAFAALAAATSDPTRSVTLAAAAKALFEAIGVGPTASAIRRLDELVAQAGQQLGREVAEELAEAGRATPPQRAAALAIGLPVPSATAAVEIPGRSGGGPGAAVPAFPGPLTDREREVAELVAQGRSNRVIGDELFITPATAARHVANIFRKLGFTSRAQIAIWVPDADAGRAGAPGQAE
jgi:predicted ATPase/DNA-binding NarL/FixJ family response regulator